MASILFWIDGHSQINLTAIGERVLM